MAEDDNFDLDIYGDGGYNGQDGPELILDAPETNGHEGGEGQYGNNAQTSNGHDATHPIQSSSNQNAGQSQQQPVQQGQKRKEMTSSEDRPTDPDATTALFISELFWWTTDDDIRGWINEAGSEDELKDVTFSEHKVNGKSKSQAYIEFTTLQAATAVKHLIEHYANTGQPGRKHSANYTNPHQNPFRTLPKDAPARKDDRNNRQFNQTGNQNMNNYGMNNNNNMGGGTGGFRGGRGGFNRGGGMGYNNRNFSGGMNNGYQGGTGGGPMGGGFQNPMAGGMGNYGGFNNRGGNMMGGGMRGGPNMRGRGGGGPNMGAAPNMMGMGMNPMGGMGMNPAMAGGMNPMMGNMGMGFQAGNFNPNFGGGFQGNPQMGNDQGSWNPHGAKRTRQE